MIEYVVSLSAALIFGPHCESGCPVLVGLTTPTGQFEAFPLGQGSFRIAGDNNEQVAIHPVTTISRQKLLSQPVTKRTSVSYGCVNISIELAHKLPRTRFQLIIKG